MATDARINVSMRFKRKWVLTTYANVAACFGVQTCPDIVFRLSGPQWRIDSGKWRRLEDNHANLR